MLANGDVIVIFLIYGQLSPIQKPYFGSHTISLSKGTIFAEKMLNFLQKC